MKKLGLVGGTGPESTAIYYRSLCYAVNERTGGEFFPPLTIENIDVNRALSYCRGKDYDGLVDYLLKAINALAAAGAQFAALTANTMHVVFDRLEALSPLPLVNIITATLNSVRANKIKRAGLLGTVFTMRGEFFVKPFAEAGIELITPPEEDMQLVADIIERELEAGVVNERSTSELIRVIRDMRDKHGAQCVILGCTELPLALNSSNCPLPCFDTMAIHIQTLADMVVEK